MSGTHEGSGGTLNVELSPADFTRLMRDIKGFDAALSKATRKRLRDAAQPAVKDVKARLMGRTFKTDAGLAKGLAAGTKVSIRTGKQSGVAITTTGAKLPVSKQAMVRAYNMKSFRHMVYGNTEIWRNQNGRPYFGQVLDSKKPAMLQAIEQALNDAAATIHAGTVT